MGTEVSIIQAVKYSLDISQYRSIGNSKYLGTDDLPGCLCILSVLCQFLGKKD